MIKIIIKEIKSAYKDMNKPLFICTVILFIFGFGFFKRNKDDEDNDDEIY